MNRWYVILLMGMCGLHAEYRLGIDSLTSEQLAQLKTKNVGLIMNQTSVNHSGARTVDVLLKHNIRVTKLFAPEHGIEGRVKAEHHVPDAQDLVTQIPIISLYGHGTGKKIEPSLLEHLDLVMFDIQDSGMRHYTYISTLYHVVQACARFNKPLWVLDRPNPLGSVMEGPLVEPHLISFISIAPIPLRHGMTMGELATYFNEQQEKKALLTVVRMQQYERNLGLSELCAPLSPHIQTLSSCYGYSFLGLLGEIRPFDVALGTDKAFQCVLLPESLKISRQQWQNLAERLASLHVETSYYRYFSQRKKKYYVGLHLRIGDINAVAASKIFLTIIAHAKKAGVKLECSAYFDKAIGTSKVRNAIMAKRMHVPLFPTFKADLERFLASVKPLLLYTPHPYLPYS